jgi:hypothetical protein
MSGTIVILEDDPRRRKAMRCLLGREYPAHTLRFFRNAPELLAWLRQGGAEVVLYSLDHDLVALDTVDVPAADPGTGRDVVDYLMTLPPACPVLIHTTNTAAALGMREALREAGWRCGRVVPFDDLGWIRTEWIDRVRKCLGGSAPGAAP